MRSVSLSVRDDVFGASLPSRSETGFLRGARVYPWADGEARPAAEASFCSEQVTAATFTGLASRVLPPWQGN